MVIFTTRFNVGRRKSSTASDNCRVFNDSFKAKYPNKTDNFDCTTIKCFQQLYKDLNNYDEHSRQTRYQFTLSNKLIWVSSDSLVPKLYNNANKKGRDKVITATFHGQIPFHRNGMFWMVISVVPIIVQALGYSVALAVVNKQL